MFTRSLRPAMTCLTIAGIGALFLLAGCDFWPPALQAQIEQLRAEAQQATADKALLQNQLNAANKAKEELQIRVEDLTRVNKEKSAAASDKSGSAAPSPTTAPASPATTTPSPSASAPSTASSSNASSSSAA